MFAVVNLVSYSWISLTWVKYEDKASGMLSWSRSQRSEDISWSNWSLILRIFNSLKCGSVWALKSEFEMALTALFYKA